MPSPFPGMDPYLEESSIWPGQHHRLISATAELLQQPLQARGYFADIGERIWLVEPQREIYPDVAVMPAVRRSPVRDDRGTVAIADEPVRVRRDLVEVSEGFVEIYELLGRRLITAIEFISPTNKSTRAGRSMYRRKQRETRRAGVSLVEVDFIRRGRRIVDVPDVVVKSLKRCDYLVNVVRHPPDDYEIYPVRLRDSLPKIRVPLKAGEEDVVLDLQAAFDRAYDAGPYSVRIDYLSPCEPPLTEDDSVWADELLKTKGFR